MVKRKDNFTVRIADKIVFFCKFRLQRPEKIQFSVANAHISVKVERLHPFFVQPHNGKPVKAEHAFPCFLHAAHIRAA